ncbi:hypothetical protein C8T65DRAFT_739183 [Cerioporus squamosus]|nr:hypothetical protein C8T65DRAFT_739183 [Cerioporus squamosus]
MVSVGLNLDNTLGAVFVGNLVAACLYGLTTLQTYTYFGRSREDSVLLRSMIAFLWILDTVHVVFISHTVYTYTVTDFGNFAALPKPVWSIVAQVIVMPLFYANMSTGVVADAAIAVTMTWLLMRERSSMNFRRTNNVIHTLVLYSISTGAFATVFFLGCLISYAVAPHTSIYIAFLTNLSKGMYIDHRRPFPVARHSSPVPGHLFLNSLLAALNSRQAIRAQMAGAADDARMLSIPHWQWQGTVDKDVGVGAENAVRSFVVDAMRDVEIAAMRTAHSQTSTEGSEATEGSGPEDVVV